MKPSELREMSPQALGDELLKLRKEQFNLRMQKASGQLGQPHLLTEARRNVARIKTILAEKHNG